MPVKILKDFLDKNHVKYSSIPHPVAYASREVSHVSHISEKSLAKTVIVFAGKSMVMVVIPSNANIDLQSLKKQLHENDVSIATEKDFSSKFPDCELGAMPPFGNLYHMNVYVEKDLAKNQEIAFNAGSHTEVVKLSYKDFENLVQPKIIDITH